MSLTAEESEVVCLQQVNKGLFDSLLVFGTSGLQMIVKSTSLQHNTSHFNLLNIEQELFNIYIMDAFLFIT